jgi:hypothetical protein
MIESGRLGNEPGCERQVSSRRLSGYDDIVEVEFILLGVLVDPPQRTAAILDRRWREGDIGESVLHVDDCPSHFQKGKERRQGALL